MKFPLILSCGHSAATMCNCWREVSKNYDQDSPVTKALEQYQGAWRQTLEGYGCHLPSGRHHGPCPVCGGKDRFRFDDKDGRGTWFCSQCEPQSGGGLLLLSRFLGKPVIDVAKELIGDTSTRSVAPKRFIPINDDEARKAAHAAAKKAAKMLVDSAVMANHEYMDKKGLSGEWLTNSQPMYSAKNDAIIKSGELLLVPAYKSGELVNVQKITNDGIKRPITGGDMQGVYHKFDGKQNAIGICEGFATGVTVSRMTGYTVYCAFNTGNLAEVGRYVREQNPSARIVFFADNDDNQAGISAAESAAIPVSGLIALPPELGDWDDYRQKHGDEACKNTMREAIQADMNRNKTQTTIETSQAAVKQIEVQHETVKKEDQQSTPEVFPPAGERNGNRGSDTKNGIEAELYKESIGNDDYAAYGVKPATTGFFASMSNQPAHQPHSASVEHRPVKTNSKLPEGITFDGLDIENPPGLAGEIVNYIRGGASRLLTGGAYAAFALQCMGMAGAGLTGFKNTKLALVTLVLGMTASGKEHPQRVIKELLSANDITVYGDIRSDKDVIRSAVFDSGRCFYVVDEAQKILTTDKQNKHMTNTVNVLMELSTTSLYQLSNLHQKEFLSQVETEKTRIEKQIDAKKNDIENKGVLDSATVKKLELDITNLESRLEDIEAQMLVIQKGVRNPALHLLASSTPQKLASIVEEDNIESGFLGRSLIFDCGVERGELLIDFDFDNDSPSQKKLDAQFEWLKVQIGLIVQLAQDASKHGIDEAFTGKEFRYRPTPEAVADLKAIAKHYDQHALRNHPRVGGIYSRFIERILSLSSIMALGNIVNGEAVIESSYVRYALLLAETSIEHLISNLRINEGATQDTMEARLEAVKEAILKRLKVDAKDAQKGWRYKSDIKNQLKRRKFYQDIQKKCDEVNQDAFENAIISMAEIEHSPDRKQVRLRR